jgi:diacylglycerol kinase (ATP)
MRYNLIYNPTAGRGRVRNALPRVLSRLERAGASVETFVTTAPGEARRYAESLPPDATLIAIGGDGTVQEAASACLGSRRVLGIVPTGSGDDFAHALGIDRHHLEAAADRILAGRTRLVDSGTANGRPFVNAAGTGFDAEVAIGALEAPWPLRERSAYLYGIFRSLARLASVPALVLLDGQQIHSGPVLLVSAQNGPRSGGSFPLAPAARVDDGLLDVVIAGRFSRLGTLGILPRVLRGTHLDHAEVRLVQGRSLSVRWDMPRPAHLEGELQPPCARFDVEIRPSSLRVFA